MKPARKGDKTAQLREGRRDSRQDAVEDCPACKTVFDETCHRPHTLPCGHTSCTPCVNDNKKEGQVTCPSCRVEHPVPEAGQFPVSYTIENLLRRMRGASLASPPPSAEKDTAESAHSLGTRPGPKGLSKRVRSLLEEQEAKILAAIHNCQKVKAQLNQYETTVRDWGRQQHDLEVRLQALIDQCKVLARQEELSASDKRQQVDQGEQQLHTVLQAVRKAASAVEAYETIEDADHVMEEETQREEECLAIIPDVHTVTTIKKATEVSQAALEAAATVQAALEAAATVQAAPKAAAPVQAALEAAATVQAAPEAAATVQAALEAAATVQAAPEAAATVQAALEAAATVQAAPEAAATVQEALEAAATLQAAPEAAATVQAALEAAATVQAAPEAATSDQAALEAAATVQAAQQTAGVGGGAAGHASLPAAAASSIRDRVDALMSPPLKSSLHPAPQSLQVEDLRSLTQHARDLLQRGLVFAVHTTEGRSRQASISLEDNRLYLHCLRDQPLPRGAVTLQVDEVVAAKPPCRVFLVLGWKDSAPRRVLIHLSTDTPYARQFLLLCTGQRGPCYNGTKLFNVAYKGWPGESVSGGDYERDNGLGGPALLPDLDEGVYIGLKDMGLYRESWMAGDVRGLGNHSRFAIITKDRPGFSASRVFGKVEVGLEVVKEAVEVVMEESRHCPIKKVTVVDCGVVVD